MTAETEEVEFEEQTGSIATDTDEDAVLVKDCGCEADEKEQEQ